MFSKVVRRTHMYLGLFLAPWMLMYSLSTMAMNHRHHLAKYFGGGQATFEKESESVYAGPFDPAASKEVVARQILATLGLDGRHSVRRLSSDESLTIFRDDPLAPRRITYTPGNGQLLVERRVLRAPAFLEGMHRRRGYDSPHRADDIWGGSVDLVIAAMAFWVASGLWMWWEMKVTRRWGAVCMVTGLGLFVVFLLVI